jgi:hypothetical protein
MRDRKGERERKTGREQLQDQISIYKQIYNKILTGRNNKSNCQQEHKIYGWKLHQIFNQIALP